MNAKPSPIYLDSAAATPMDPRVLKVMLPYFCEKYGNPSSLHTLGSNAREAVDRARKTIADFLDASPSELIFTGSGTESDNLAIFGIAEAYASHGKHLITTTIEHDAVLQPMKALEKKGFRVTYLPVDRDGIVSLEALKKALTKETILVSIMAANNEIGTLQPLAEIAQILKNHRKENTTEFPFFHTDACQTPGALKLDVKTLGIDLLTLNGSKIYGPKGIGLLWVKKGIKITPQILGGGQEQGLRAGTHNVPAIVGFAEALRLIETDRDAESKRLKILRNHFLDGLRVHFPQLKINGNLDRRLLGNLNLTLHAIPGEVLLMKLDNAGIYASAGSACTAGSADPSHVLLALGLSREAAFNSIRFSFGRFTTKKEVDAVLKIFQKIACDLKKQSGVYK
ncbi:MAG: cysteine desulfurase family protein [Candidatus Gracilibacteria bacterium]